MATFSDTSTRINTSGISVVFAYKLALFSGSLEGPETCKSWVFEPAYDFGISGLYNSLTWYHAIAARVKPYFYGFSAFSDICFTNLLSSGVQRGLFCLVFGVNNAFR